MNLASESGNAKEEAILMEDSLTLMEFDKSLKNDLKGKISFALSN